MLTFGSPRQIKNLFDVEGSRARQPRPAQEINLPKVLEGLSYTQEQFIEFCILCGCDYLPHLARMGPKTAAQILQREGSLKAVVRCIQGGQGPKGCSIPEKWDWSSAKQLFQKGAKELSADALDALKTQQAKDRAKLCDFEQMRQLLVEKHQFSSSRVDTMVERLRKALAPGGAASNRRIESFFSASPKRRRTAERPPIPVVSGDSGDEVVVCDDIVEIPVEAAEHESEWNCEKCTFCNHAKLSSCEMCQHPRGAQRAKPGSGKWPPGTATKVTATKVIDLDD